MEENGGEIEVLGEFASDEQADSYAVYFRADGELSPATVHWRVRDL